MKTKQTTRYVCEHCGKDGAESTIRRHEKQCGRLKVQRSLVREANAECVTFRLRATSLSDFAKLITDHVVRASGVKCRCAFDGCSISASVSNSHSAPVDGVTNWGRESGKPLGYPGVSCSFNVYIDSGYNRNVADAIDRIRRCRSGLNTGTGGSRGHGMGWSCQVFASDFPLWGDKIDTWVKANKDLGRYQREADEAAYRWQTNIDAYVAEDADVVAAITALKMASDTARARFEAENEMRSPVPPEMNTDQLHELRAEILGDAND